jgi:hypothetical protein
MLTVADARVIANEWRARFVDESAFEASWQRYFETATVPDETRLEAWLRKDLAKDQIVHAGIVKEPLLPVMSRFELSECVQCDGKRYVRLNVPISHPQFGKAQPCPECGYRT